jgi:hypothetical protein
MAGMFGEKEEDKLLKVLIRGVDRLVEIDTKILQALERQEKRSAILHFKIIQGGRRIMGSSPTPFPDPLGTQLQAIFTEYSGPNGTGTVVPPVGNLLYESDSPAVATVDPASGVVTPVSATASGTGGVAGLATISCVDQGNAIQASAQIQVSSTTAQSATLTFGPVGGEVSAALKGGKTGTTSANPIGVKTV